MLSLKCSTRLLFNTLAKRSTLAYRCFASETRIIDDPNDDEFIRMHVVSYLKDGSITMWTCKGCEHCKAAKDLFKSKSIPFNEINVDKRDDSEAMKKALFNYTS